MASLNTNGDSNTIRINIYPTIGLAVVELASTSKLCDTCKVILIQDSLGIYPNSYQKQC